VCFFPSGAAFAFAFTHRAATRSWYVVTHKKEFAPVRSVREYGALLATYASDDAARDAASLARLSSLDPGMARRTSSLLHLLYFYSDNISQTCSASM
jgi:hypothetical protein